MDRGESVDLTTTQGRRTQDFQKRGREHITNAEGARFLDPREVWGMLPQKVLKISVSEMVISSILRQISYSFNRIRDMIL